MFTKKSFIILTILILLSACTMPQPENQGQSQPNGQEQVSANQGSVDQSQIAAPDVNQPQVQPADSTSALSDAPHTSDVDLTHLEIGNGKYSTNPQAGYVYTCQTNFNGGGPATTGNWVNGDGTWDATKKLVIDGSVTWPHSFEVTVQGDQRVFTGNDLPDHPTGTYPVQQSDDAYAIDRNPHSIESQTISFSVPANPTAAASPNCIGGEVGIMLSGVVLFNSFDAAGRDALVHEIQDECDGHPQQSGFYHYHSLSDCIEDNATGHSALMGYAFDGYGIYGYYGEDGSEVTNDELDACHGHTHVIEWDGQMVEMYHYHATHEFPYVVGCFHGTPSVRGLSTGLGQGGNQPQQNGNQQGGQPQQAPQTGTGQGQPPQEAINACSGLSQGAACSVGPMSGTCMTPPNTTQLACVPAGGPPQ